MPLVSRADHFKKVAARAKLLKRRGVVMTRRDLEDFLALLDGVEDALTKGGKHSQLLKLLEPFKELTDE